MEGGGCIGEVTELNRRREGASAPAPHPQRKEERPTVVVRSSHMTLGLLERIEGQNLCPYSKSGLKFHFLMSEL